MAEYKRKDMPEDMIVRISPGRNTITVQECSANGVVSYREIDPIEFYFALNGSCISNVYQRSGFLPEHCLHISMNAEECSGARSLANRARSVSNITPA